MRSVLIAALLVLMGAGGARASVTGLARTDQPQRNAVTGVAITDKGVLWAEMGPFKRVRSKPFAIRSVVPGQSPVTRHSVRVAQHAFAPAFDAAGDQMAVGGSDSSLLAGPIEGPLRSVGDRVQPKSVRFSGSLLASAEVTGATLRDAARGYAASTLRADPNVYDVRVAGGRAALATIVDSAAETKIDLRIDVIALADSRVEYSVTLDDVAHDVDWELQADGKLAWIAPTTRVQGRAISGILSWASPQDPRAHDLVTDAAQGTLHIGGDRIVFTKRVGGWGDQAILQPWVTDLAANARPIWFPLAGPLQSDLEGDALAIAAGGCVWLGDLADRLDAAPSGKCPQIVTAPGRRSVGKGGLRYRYGIHCVQAPASGCRGEAIMEVARSETGARTMIARRRFSARLGRTASVTFRNSRARLRRHRNRKGSVWMFVRVLSEDPAGVTSESESFPFAVRP